TFTLSGLAGIVLTLGMAVDANVLIYERLREERERGASLLQAIRNGYDHALPTIIDTHLSSIFTAIVLYIVGNDNLKGFAISMTVGLVISLFTSLFMTRLLFDYWQSKGWLTKLTMMRLFGRPDWDFMSIRYIMFAATLGLSIVGATLFIGRLPAVLNIDFVGGTAYGGKLREAKTMEDLRPLIEEKNQKETLAGVLVKEVEGSEGRRFQLTFPKGDKTPRMVSFSVMPKGETREEREADVKLRAELLEDATITPLFDKTSDEKIIAEIQEGKSRSFQMRTTEKEAELVQACADQLFRDKDGKPMLEKVVVRRHVVNQDHFFRFYQTEQQADAKGSDGKIAEPTAFVSPSYVKSLLNREFRRAFSIKDDKPLPFILRVDGEGERDTGGRYKTIKVAFEEQAAQKVANFEAKVDEAFRSAEKALAHPLPDQLSNFDSGLANETRIRAMAAILASWAAILLYLWFRFGNWTFGLAAVICLIHDLFFTLGAIALCHFVHGGPLGFIGDWLLLDDFKIDLPSVAALLTLVGYSVNDTIVVFDRIREVRGKNPDLTPKMLNDSVNQTLSRTILSSLTVWLVVFVLYLFGGPGVHLFAFVMVVGVIVGTYSSIYIAAPLLIMFGEGKHEETTAVGQKLTGGVPEPAATA
ncbi:MAG: protein translocase subunit SecF, partial [Planctomycetes bacterium]|nr:protein translocase subunit SecF [Planctomycetota bacterium]